MLVDALCAAALAHELRRDIVGSRVQQALQPHRLALSLELYAGRRWYLELAADPASENVALGAARPRRGEGAATPLTLAARSRLVGARVRAVESPPLERILSLAFEGASTHRIVVEMMGRMANVILVDADDIVVACARRVTPDMTRARVVLPGRPYEPPPPPRKAPPSEATPDEIGQWLEATPAVPAWRALVDHVRGLSPMAAREAVARASEAAGEPTPAAIATELSGLFAPLRDGDWSPSIARSGVDVVAFAPYRITPASNPSLRITSVEATATLAEAMSAYAAGRRSRDPYRDAREAVAAAIETARDKLGRRAAALERERWDESDVEALREAGDLILTHQTRVARGDIVLEAPDLDGRGGRTIALDPALSPVENATAYYERYRSRTRANASYASRAAEVEAEMATLEQWAVDLVLAEDRPGIDGVRDALVEAGYCGGGRRIATPSARPLEITSSDGLRILVGRNSRQNDRVTFTLAARGDLWAHVRGAPGGHVVVRSAGREVPEGTVLEAAALAGYFSRARGEARVDVVVTEVRHVRRLPGAGPGLVTYEKERTITVAPRSPDDIDTAWTRRNLDSDVPRERS